MTTFAFDLHGTLTHHPALRVQAAALLDQGHEVHVISAIADGDPNEGAYRARIASWGVPFTGIHFVRFGGVAKPDGVLEYAVGGMKAEVMCHIGASVLVDDNPHICRAVRDAGLTAAPLTAVWIGG